VALIYHPSTLKQKQEAVAKEPELAGFFDRLEKRIEGDPELGLPDTCLLENGKSVSCFKQSVEVYLFSGRIRYGRNQLTLMYLYNESTILIFKIYFSG
jgi:hypothetical protein